MRCNRCHQNSIKIYNDSDIVKSLVHLKCDVCGLYIECGIDDELLCDLFIYNENIEEAERLGRESHREGKELENNPYSTDSSQIQLYNSWNYGYKEDKRDFEYTALSFSSKKVETELNREIQKLESEVTKYKEIEKKLEDIKDEKDMLGKRIRWFIQQNSSYLDEFYSKLLSIKILGRFLKKHILSFKKEYGIFYKKYGIFKDVE